jgi:transposase
MRDRLIRLAQRHPSWVVGFADETWWSRVAQPSLHAWADPDHVVRLVEQTVAKNDPDPKALACYGLLLRAADDPGRTADAIWLRFVEGRPLSALTTDFLAWCVGKLAAQGKNVLVLVWDNASWHISREVRTGLRAHNRTVKRSGNGVRILPCPLPIKSPWLNPIEPHWVHGKRRVVEPARLLTARELEERICAALGASREDHLAISAKVA